MKAVLDAIDPMRLYPKRAFQRVSGFGDAAWRAARKNGLVVRQLHGRSFVHGADFIRYVLTQSPSRLDRDCNSGDLE